MLFASSAHKLKRPIKCIRFTTRISESSVGEAYCLSCPHPSQQESLIRFCQSCLDHVRKCEEYCPWSSDIIKAISNNIIREITDQREIFDLEVRCLNLKCKFECQLKDLSQHLEVCDYRQTTCNKCGERYLYKYQSEHQCFHCKMDIATNDQCGCEIMKKDLDGMHKNVEGNIDDLCDKWKGVCSLGCCDDVQDNRKVHLSVCPYMTVECALKELGCTKTLRRIDMKDHIVYHVHLMNKEIMSLRQDNLDLRHQVVDMDRKMTSDIGRLSKEVQSLKTKMVLLTQAVVSITESQKILTRSIVKNGFGGFTLGYGDVKRVIFDDRMQERLDTNRMTIKDTTLLPGITLYFILYLNYETGTVTIRLFMSESSLLVIASLNPTSIKIQWDNATQSLSFKSNDEFKSPQIGIMTITMDTFIEDYPLGENLCLGIEALQIAESEVGGHLGGSIPQNETLNND